MSNPTDLATMDGNDLGTVHGGDGWQDYKDKISADARDTAARANEAIKYNAVNGNFQPGKFIDNAAGTIYDGGKTVRDATGGQILSVLK